jgi:putative aldouronate transport system substrate-binding protein
VSSQGQSGNKQFVMQAIAPFTASGTGTPKVERGNSASMFSYVNKKLSKTQIEEVLRIADYIAAPFGSLEYTLTTYGPEGVDWTRSADGPKLTATGTKEVQPTFQFLSTAPSVTTRPGYPAFVKAYAAWQAKAAALSFEPLFFAQNITEPSQYNGIGQTVEDTIKDVVRGRKTIADLRTAVTAWRTRGGDALRSFYEKELASGGSTS